MPKLIAKGKMLGIVDRRMAASRGERLSRQTKPGRYQLSKMLKEIGADPKRVLHVGIGHETRNMVYTGPIQLLELASSTDAHIDAIDIDPEAVKDAKRALSTGKVVLSKRMAGIRRKSSAPLVDYLKKSLLWKNTREVGDFWEIGVPRDAAQRVTVEKRDLSLSSPMKKYDLVVATNVLQYIKPSEAVMPAVANHVREGGHIIIDYLGYRAFDWEKAGFKKVAEDYNSLLDDGIVALKKVEPKTLDELAGIPQKYEVAGYKGIEIKPQDIYGRMAFRFDEEEEAPRHVAFTEEERKMIAQWAKKDDEVRQWLKSESGGGGRPHHNILHFIGMKERLRALEKKAAGLMESESSDPKLKKNVARAIAARDYALLGKYLGENQLVSHTI